MCERKRYSPLPRLGHAIEASGNSSQATQTTRPRSVIGTRAMLTGSELIMVLTGVHWQGGYQVRFAKGNG